MRCGRWCFVISPGSIPLKSIVSRDVVFTLQEKLFDSANQLLSVLALVACAVFLKKTKRQGCMLWIPMVFMMAVTFTALGMTISKLTKALFTTGLDLGNTLQLIFAVLLLILGVLVAIQGVKKLFEKNDEKQTA